MKPLTTKLKGDEVRRRLIEIAGQIFAETGYEAATVRQITDRAKVNIAAVNYYFGDKFQLYRAVLQSVTERLLELLKQSCVEGSAEERLRNLVHCVLEVSSSSEEPMWVHLLMARELVEQHDDKTELFIEAIRPIHEITASIVTDLLGEQADPVAIRIATGLVIPICVNRIPQQRIEQKLYLGTDFSQVSLEEMVELLYRFLLAGIRGLSERRFS
ncbi:TetR/AcrR family transcriptional regulator [Telmatobacter bradus]|uniref:TetR/AcrR family transcriptional regulator n=1 Tax=Telmatobacter bradus TaxID=474953 RepID=UPI003B43CC74